MDGLEFLVAWYGAHCDGDWEHQFGISITTLDNPGWYLTVNVTGTEVEERSFARVEVERSDTDWVFYWCDGSRFTAACGAANLVESLGYFRAFAEGSP
jgi:hypothetical protein